MGAVDAAPPARSKGVGSGSGSVDTAAWARKPTEPPKLIWLTYRRPDGRADGVVESCDLPVSNLSWQAPIAVLSAHPD
jgi:hypothetical protein